MAYTVQVAPEDCTGCALCVEACPAKDKTKPARKAINMAPQPPLREAEAANWEFFLTLPEVDRTTVQPRHHQELAAAASRCLSSPAPAPAAARRLTSNWSSQLFGDRAIIANATGCSSIYGGNLPTTP